jgi:hypothetical protein
MAADASVSAYGSYVRFYLTVVEQLSSAWASVERTHEVSRVALAPFGDVLAPVGSAALAAALGPVTPSPALFEELWVPEDKVDLSGLTDLYEVVGRFSFQGEDNENIARVQALVAAARNEIYEQKARLSALSELASQARTFAERGRIEETRKATQRREGKLAALVPLAETLVTRAKQTIEAVQAVPLPSLMDVGTAGDEYKRYIAKLDQVYATCLPFVTKSVESVYEFVLCEIPASFPEKLPLVHELPQDLVSVPPEGSAELSSAREAGKSLDEEEQALLRARDEVQISVTRAEQEIAATSAKLGELNNALAIARGIVDYANAHAELAAADRGLADLERQKGERLTAMGEAHRRHEQTKQAIAAMEQEQVQRTREIGDLEERLEQEQKSEPVLFGKDDWRLRISGVEQEIATQREAFSHRYGVLNQTRVELSSLSVQHQTEQAQAELVDRWLVDQRQKRAAAVKLVAEIEQRLGTSRPAKPPRPDDAAAYFDAEQLRHAELAERIDRLRLGIRQQREDEARAVVRLRQIQQEKQRAEAMQQNAAVLATQGRDAALRALAVRRREAVEEHVNEVIGSLVKSLEQVEEVFVKPAEQAILQREQPDLGPMTTLLGEAEKVAVVVDNLVRDLEPDLLTQDAMLGQVQREFCDAAPTALPKAW